jgi:RNA polymerase sigma factor (sigma-70 family)
MGVHAVRVPAGVERGGDIGGLYRSLSKRLEQIVRFDVLNAPDPVVEDACQFAWDRLIRNHARIRRETALPWLARTAVREARRLLKRERRWLPLEDGALALDELEAPESGDLLERRARLDAIGELPERQQRLVWLHALGLTYAEIAMHTGDTTRTVERQLLRAKRALHAADAA